MKILDCGSLPSTIDSLAAIFSTSQHEVEQFVETLNLAAFRRKSRSEGWSPDQLMLFLWTQRVGVAGFDATCWFHLTRAEPGEQFLDGLLPLGSVLPRIWASMKRLLKGKLPPDAILNLETVVAGNCGNHYGYLYTMKARDRIHWGPYAVLVQDAAFRHSEIGLHDYLGSPEIVEDICYCVQKKYGIDLLALYRESTRPCIVKFLHQRAKGSHLGVALYYVYCVKHKNRLFPHANTCFDGGGVPIPKDQILDIRMLG